MLEHPEIGWIERTGYPSWLQQSAPRLMKRRKNDGKTQVSMGDGLFATAGTDQRLGPGVLSAPAQGSGQDPGLSPG